LPCGEGIERTRSAGRGKNAVMRWLSLAMELPLLWIAVSAVLVGVIAAMAIRRVTRRVDVDQLGAVSNQWIAQHRAQ
jgi:hypothetical protein